MQTVGKTCPYCRSKIAVGEEAAICSVCEMPHHLECWVENQGCTTFGCPGTIIPVPSGSAGTPADMRRCPGCGFGLPPDAVFCRKCGARVPVEPPPVPPAPAPQDSPAAQAAAVPVVQTAPAFVPQATQERRCIKCGFAVPADALFCRRCGTPAPKEQPAPPRQPVPPVDRYCVQCGQKADSDAVFCKKCGSRLPVMPG